MTFLEQYRAECNPQRLDLLDVMAGGRGRSRAAARRAAAQPSKAVATGIVLLMTVTMLGITAVVLWKVR